MKSKSLFMYLLVVVFCVEKLFGVSSELTTYSFWCGANPAGAESATAWYDDKVCVMIEAETPSDRNAAAMADFVKFMHDLYDAFELQTGLTDLPLNGGGWNGRIVVQIPLDNCGAGGLAHHGSTGISVGAGLFRYQYTHCLAGDNTYLQVWFYETNRNFWPSSFNRKFDWAMDSSPSDYGFWTVGMNNAQAYTMCHFLGCKLDYYGQNLTAWHDNLLNDYLGCINGGYTWDTGWIKKFMPWRSEQTINNLFSGFIIYSYDNWGGFAFLKRFYEWIQSPEISSRSDVLAYQECRDNTYKIWSMAAGQDLRSHFESTLQWTLTNSAKSWVASKLNGSGQVLIAPTNSGAAGGDAATGTGYLMYSEQNVHTRFTSPAVHADQADHLVIVRYNNGWEYDYNHATSDWVSFVPAAGDLLLAELDFDTDVPTSLEGVNQTENGIAKGYASGDLVYHGNQWNGSFNDGEWDVTGTYFVPNGSPVYVAPLNSGAAGGDAATGTGYLMYSEQNVHTRFTSPAVHADQADHLVIVRYNNGWEYDYNHAISDWVSFVPAAGDVLLAELDFDTDVPTSLEGVDQTENGITKGYASGDLVYHGDQWNGSFNDGEWDVTGTYFIPN